MFLRSRARGQGLVNLLFAKNKDLVILTPEDQYSKRSWGRAFHMLALIAGNRPVTVKTDTPTPRNTDYTVNTERFRSVLEKIKATNA